MPLVRIAYLAGKPQGFGQKAADIIYRTMVAVINVPAEDNFQIITEHAQDSLIYDPHYLGITRSDGIIFIQITLNEGRTVEMKKAFYKTLNEGRTVEMKKAFYKTLTQRLNQELGVRQEDVLINLVEVKKENWSFGNGIAPYAD